MQRTGNRATELLVLLLLAALAVAPALAHDAEATDQVIKVVRLKHLETELAVTVLRSIFQTRQIAELRGRGIIIFRDSPEAVERATKLLREIDVPSPSKEESAKAAKTGRREAGADGV